MDVPNQLETLLQFLVTDASSVVHLSYILSHLSSSSLVPSPHLQKWVARITSLMRSKDPAARWAALCIAYRMSLLSKSLLFDNAQSWVGIAFPSLSKPEPVPILMAAMRYLNLVLCTAEHNLEFQRQVAIPILPKVSSELLTIAEKHDDRNVKTSSIRTLAQLILLYPSLHKALSQRLYMLCNRTFSSPAHRATDGLLDATINLYSVLPFLGGKAGSANLWGNCLDETLQLSWSAWLTLRTTFPTSAQMSHKVVGHFRSADSKPDPISYTDTMTSDPLTTVALHFDKLKCGVGTICALLRAPVSRPVRVPIGCLVTFCWCLLTSTLDEEEPSHIDPHVRIAESAVVSQIWVQACHLLSCLARTTQELLVPHVPRLITVISSRLENHLEHSQRHSFLRCAYQLLYSCPVVGAALGVNRLLKATIFILSPLYLHQSRTETKSGATNQNQSRASRKRRRGYEADNTLSVPNRMVCETKDEGDVLIAALDVVDLCVSNTELAPSIRSLANRVLLSTLLSLSSTPPLSLSSDTSFHGRVSKKIRNTCIKSVQGMAHDMNKSSGLALRSFYSENVVARDEVHSYVDLLLHPRRPPFVRILPFVESLSLSSAEESTEETATRHALGLIFGDEEARPTSSELPNPPEPVNQKSLHLDNQIPLDPPQERVSSTFIKLHPQATSDASNDPMEATGLSVISAVPPSRIMQNDPTGSTLSTFQKGTPPAVSAIPMLIDDSDHEEVPTIDLGSDSDA